MNVTKIVVGTSIGAGILWLISNLMSKKKVGDKLDTATSAMVHSLDLKGLTIRVDVVLKNPTEGTLTIKQPYIKLSYDGKDVGASQIVGSEITIKPYSAVPLAQPIYLNIPATGLITLGNGLFKTLVKKQPAKITIVTYSSIKLPTGFVSYSKTDVINLKPKTK